VMLCISALMRRQWDAERLSYPIAEVPVQVILNRGQLFHSPLLWAGMTAGAFGQVVNLWHNLWPPMPEVPIGVQYCQFPDLPLSAAGAIPVSIFPFAVGLSFLLPRVIQFWADEINFPPSRGESASPRATKEGTRWEKRVRR